MGLVVQESLLLKEVLPPLEGRDLLHLLEVVLLLGAWLLRLWLVFDVIVAQVNHRFLLLSLIVVASGRTAPVWKGQTIDVAKEGLVLVSLGAIKPIAHRRRARALSGVGGMD